jgi:hypothetical protein
MIDSVNSKPRALATFKVSLDARSSWITTVLPAGSVYVKLSKVQAAGRVSDEASCAQLIGSSLGKKSYRLTAAPT